MDRTKTGHIYDLNTSDELSLLVHLENQTLGSYFTVVETER